MQPCLNSFLGSRRVGRLFPAEQVVDGAGSSSPEDQGDPYAHHKDEEFNSFALLLAGPVHEESVAHVEHRGGHRQFEAYEERGDAGEGAEDQRNAAEELDQNGGQGEDPRNVEGAGEKLHGAGVTVAAEQAEQLLCAMRKDHDAQGQPQE